MLEMAEDTLNEMKNSTKPYRYKVGAPGRMQTFYENLPRLFANSRQFAREEFEEKPFTAILVGSVCLFCAIPVACFLFFWLVVTCTFFVIFIVAEGVFLIIGLTVLSAFLLFSLLVGLLAGIFMASLYLIYSSLQGRQRGKAD